MVQTFNPDHPAIVAASSHDYVSFANAELDHRRDFAYPPFGCLARYVTRGPVESKARQMADKLAELAEQWPGCQEDCRVVGPAEAPITKLRGNNRAVTDIIIHIRSHKIFTLYPFCSRLGNNINI